MQHTKPASGHPPDTPLSTSWLVPVWELARSAGSRGARRDRLSQDLWLADWFAVDCPREIDSRRAFRRHVDWTGPRAVDTLSGAVSQSVHHPFFSAPSKAANRAQLGRFHFSLLRLLPELSQLGLEVGPRGLILLGTCFVCQRALRQVLRDRSTAAAWFRHLLHSARSSRYFSRSLLRLFNKDRTRIRCGDFASSVLFKIRFGPTALASMPELLASETPS